MKRAELGAKAALRRGQPDVDDVLARLAGELGVDLRRFAMRDRIADHGISV